MEDSTLATAINTVSNSPQLNTNTMVPDDGNQSSATIDRGSEGHHEDFTALSLKLVEEIKTLQHVLSEFERRPPPVLSDRFLEEKSRPTLVKEALEAEWERARQERGPEEEMKAWRAEMRRRKSGLIAVDPFQLRSRLGHRYDSEPSKHDAEDVYAYNAKLFKLRERWEKKVGSYLELDQQIDQTDSEDTDDSDRERRDQRDREELRRRILMATSALHREKEYLEQEFEEKKRIRDMRRTRRMQRIQAKEMKEIIHFYNQQGEKEQQDAPSGPAEKEGPSTSGEQDVHLKSGEQDVHLKSGEQDVPSAISEQDIASSKVETAVVKDIIPDAPSQMVRVPWSKFKALRAEKWASAAIHVLIGEPVIQFKTYERWLTSRSRKIETQAQEKKTVSKLELATEEATMPERIRINSSHIRRILSGVLKDDGQAGFHNSSSSSIVMIRPYKALAYYDQVIRDRCKKLEKMLHRGNSSASHSAKTPDNADSTTVVDSTAQEKQIDKNPLPVEEAAQGNESGGAGKGRDEQEVDEDVTELPVTLEHMKCLLEFMDKDLKKRTSHIESSSCQNVYFSDLWYLFQPGGLVIKNDGKQAYRILSMYSIMHKATDPLSRYYDRFMRKESEEEEEEASITIKCVYIDFDGKKLGPVPAVFQIPRFEREMAVTSLPIYPLQFHPFQKRSAGDDTVNPGIDLKSYLVDRGRMFLKVAALHQTTVQPMYYDGPALKPLDEIESQVVVDFEAALGVENHIKDEWRPELHTLIGSEDDSDEEGGEDRCIAGCCVDEEVYDDSYIEQKMNKNFMGRLIPQTREETPSVVIIPRPLDNKTKDAGLEEDDLVIMSYRVFGYVLRNRKWAQLDLTYLSDAQPSGAIYKDDKMAGGGLKKAVPAFDQLILPSGHKEMILSLITQHFRDKESNSSERRDIVRGKGKGLIILLHGAPGVGKTTTAEGVAERFKKPLFQLTCGDLGTTAKEVEVALETNFALASRWGCVLLLDEADVFLAQRTKEDFKRNGLVAVFLRVLEYYSGILFLTTNRVGDFDEAFASRIHISLYYPELGRKETLDVFKLNLKLIKNRFQDKSRELIIDEMDIAAFAQDYWDKHPFDHWNGRQIRNACQTAAALAEYEVLGQKDSIPLNTRAEVQLKVSHFQTVADAYLAFSSHLKDIYGTHTARRAKEAGLRAMWVNEKGEPMGNIGPKEAGALKWDRKSRFKQRSQGQSAITSYEQQNRMMAPTAQVLPYQGGQIPVQGGGVGGQGYNAPPPHVVQPRPTRHEFYEEPYMAQQHSNIKTQQQRQRMVPRYPQDQDRDAYHSEYVYDQQQHEAAGRETHLQNRGPNKAQHLNPHSEVSSRTRRQSAGDQTQQYDHDDPEYE